MNLHEASRLTLRPLSVVQDGEEYVVGSRETGVFLSLPEIAVAIIQEFQAGRTLAEVAVVARNLAGEDVDLADFVATLTEAGFVLAIDGQTVGGGAAAAALPVEEEEAEAASDDLLPLVGRILFSPVAWGIYGLAAVACAAIFVWRPAYLPVSNQLFFHTDLGLSLWTLVVTALLLAMGHETFHWLAARATGVQARVRINRRLFLLVLETDLSELWSLPRNRRYGAFLAGMAFDVMILLSVLVLRLLNDSEVLVTPSWLYGLLGAAVILQLTSLLWQCLVFYRTDLHAVLITALGCRNLYRVTYLSLIRRIRQLTPAEAVEWKEARPTDLRVARWFAWSYVVGIGVALWWALRFFPGFIVAAQWLWSSLQEAPVRSWQFWSALATGLLSGAQLGVPLWLYVRQRIARRREEAV